MTSASRPEITGQQWHRLRTLVADAYTLDAVTTGGIVKRRAKTNSQLAMARAHAVVEFMVDHVCSGYLAPAGLWDDVFTQLIDDGELVRDELGNVRHRTDRRTA